MTGYGGSIGRRVELARPLGAAAAAMLSAMNAATLSNLLGFGARVLVLPKKAQFKLLLLSGDIWSLYWLNFCVVNR